MRVTVLSKGRIDGLVPYVNGKKHGVGIKCDAAGYPTYEVAYENGGKKRSRLTRQALAKIAAEISADAEKRRKSWRARVINERTILYEVRVQIAKPEKWGQIYFSLRYNRRSSSWDGSDDPRKIFCSTLYGVFLQRR